MNRVLLSQQITEFIWTRENNALAVVHTGIDYVMYGLGMTD